MTVEGTDTTAVGEPELQRWPAPVTLPSGERAASSSLGEEMLQTEGRESQSDSPSRVEETGVESLTGAVPRLEAEASLDADAQASNVDNAAPAIGEEEDKKNCNKRGAGGQHLGKTTGREFGMARPGWHVQNGSHLQAAKNYKNRDGRPSSGACERREA